VVLWCWQVEAKGADGGGGAAAYLKFRVDVVEVFLDCLWGDGKLQGDLGVALAGRQQCEYQRFSACQSIGIE
jgi:hypothetical protein